jgi:hypothetical protein
VSKQESFNGQMLQINFTLLRKNRKERYLTDQNGDITEQASILPFFLILYFLKLPRLSTATPLN